VGLSRRFKLLLILALLLVVAIGTHLVWLPWLGHALVHDDGPAKADIAVTLAGDGYGHRIEKGAQLVKDGYVPAVLVSGPPLYGVHECDLAIAMMQRKGYPGEWFIAFPDDTHSTAEEARVLLLDLQRRGVKSFLLITSNYHSGRARRIFLEAERKVGVGLPFRMVAADDEFFKPDSWWRDREAQKTVLLEWTKTFATVFGK